MTDTSPSALASDEILRRAARRGGEALDELLPALADRRVEVTELVRRPRLLADLDARCRSYLRESVIAPESYFLDRPSPLTAALATMSRDGHIRESAVVALADASETSLFPFLVLRCGDWVRQVREAARAAVARILDADLARHLPAVLPMAAYTASRRRGGWAMTHLREALAGRFDELGRALVRSRNQRERRLAYEIGADLGRWSHDDLVHFAVHAKDPIIRLRSVDAVSATADVATLRLLVRSRFSGVRASALVGLARLGLDDEVTALMDDPAPIVRAYARSRATDPLAHYRAAVSTGPVPATVAGLGEVGRYADEALLVPLLRHGEPRVRAAAVKALAAIDCLRAADVGPLTRDSSAVVAKAARKALQSRGIPYDAAPPVAP